MNGGIPVYMMKHIHMNTSYISQSQYFNANLSKILTYINIPFNYIGGLVHNMHMLEKKLEINLEFTILFPQVPSILTVSCG